VGIPKIAAWLMSVVLFAAMVAIPFVYYRANYTHAKRLRPVTEGKLYRSGCMTAEGFADAIRAHRIRTVINLMDDDPDPDLPAGYFDHSGTRESELCAHLNVKMVQLSLDLLPPAQQRDHHPVAIQTFLALMDRPGTYPALIHCRAGLHRTGVMVAIYRMEYEGWTRDEAMRELKANGFGEYAATAANDYINQYVLHYEPRRLTVLRRDELELPVHVTPVRVHGGIEPGY
jgi:protein tyrosine/serine phosphatase